MVGTDSYVALSEAEDYVLAFYAGTEAGATWNARTTEQKELMLTSACADLDSLPFIGRKAERGQSLAFPRQRGGAVPKGVKFAQIEIALLPLRDDAKQAAADAAERAMLQRQGVKSFSLGDLSESYSGSSGLPMNYPFMSDPKIARLLGPWLSGGYATC